MTAKLRQRAITGTPAFAHIARIALLLLIYPILAAHAECANSHFAADALIAKWNERVTTAKLKAAWHLEKYSGLGFIRQNLDGTSLLFTAKVDKSGCVTRADIKSRRADADGFAAQVAWLFLIEATNPDLPKEQRIAVIKALKLDQPDAGGSDKVNHVTYSYVEDTETNDLWAAPSD